MAQDFLLERLRPVLGTYLPPETGFEGAGSWEHVYELFSAPLGPFLRNGELRMRRTSLARGGYRLGVASRRRGNPGFSFFVDAEFTCGPGAPAPLQAWNSFSRMAAAAADPPYLNSGLKKQGAIRGNTLEVRAGGQKVRTSATGVCIAKWCIVENVQRLARQRQAHGFSLLDEVDEVRTGQELRFRGEVQATVGGAARVLGVYEHLGEGVIPACYYTDERNRVLFIVSGIEIHVLRESGGRPAAYTVQNPPVRTL